MKARKKQTVLSWGQRIPSIASMVAFVSFVLFSHNSVWLHGGDEEELLDLTAGEFALAIGLGDTSTALSDGFLEQTSTIPEGDLLWLAVAANATADESSCGNEAEEYTAALGLLWLAEARLQRAEAALQACIAANYEEQPEEPPAVPEPMSSMFNLDD